MTDRPTLAEPQVIAVAESTKLTRQSAPERRSLRTPDGGGILLRRPDELGHQKNSLGSEIVAKLVRLALFHLDAP